MSLMAAAIQGLPPLPKSLSGLLNFNKESMSREAGLRQATQQQQQQPQKQQQQANSARLNRESYPSRSHVNNHQDLESARRASLDQERQRQLAAELRAVRITDGDRQAANYDQQGSGAIYANVGAEIWRRWKRRFSHFLNSLFCT